MFSGESLQCLFHADVAVEIKRAVFVVEGTQPELRNNKSKITLIF